MTADAPSSLQRLSELVATCRACPRLVECREEVARERRAAYRDETYWGRPVPGMGDPHARVMIVGLAPAAHGGNRTGRIFTGDRSGDWLFASLHRCGFANQAESLRRGDGLRLIDAYITAAVRCAPPENRPLPAERDRCRPYLVREMQLLERLAVVVALGAFAWDAVLRADIALGGRRPRPRPRFSHGAEVTLHRFTLLGCFHPSQQNTFTGKLTTEMLDATFRRAASFPE